MINIEEAKSVLREHGYFVDIMWSKADIQTILNRDGITMTDDEIDNVAERVMKNFDANLGINWDSIEYAIKEERNG